MPNYSVKINATRVGDRIHPTTKSLNIKILGKEKFKTNLNIQVWLTNEYSDNTHPLLNMTIMGVSNNVEIPLIVFIPDKGQFAKNVTTSIELSAEEGDTFSLMPSEGDNGQFIQEEGSNIFTSK